MPDVRALRTSLPAFAAEVGRPLTPWQAAALTLEARVSALRAPRQSGKSRSLAVLALWRAFREPAHRVLIVSAGEEAARRLLAEVRSIAVGSPLLASSVVDEQAALVTLANGSEVRSVPASERQVRGWTVDTLLVDEAALVPDDLLLGAALPTTAARPQARIVLASSPLTAAGAFYDFVIRGEAGSEHVRAHRWLLADAEWITPSVVAAARESMSELRYRSEYEAEFASGADALFTRQALERATVDYLPDDLAMMDGPARVLAGQDWGAVNDRSALVAIGRLAGPERRFAVRCVKRWEAGYPLPRVLDEIVGSPAHYHTLAAETNGLGLPLAQELAARLRRRAAHAGGHREAGPVLVDEDDFDRWTQRRERRREATLPVRIEGPGLERRGSAGPPFSTWTVLLHTTADMKAAGYSALRLLIERELLMLPASAGDLLRELLMLRVDLTPSGGERIEAGSGHDDLADALMLACLPSRSRHDGRWRVYLAQLADPRQRLPRADVDVGVLEGLPTVSSMGGVRVPRTPAWASVYGREVTLPAAAVPADTAARRRDQLLELRRDVLRLNGSQR